MNQNEIIGKLYTEVEEFRAANQSLQILIKNYEKRISHTEGLLSRFHNGLMNEEFYNDIRLCLSGLDNRTIKITDLMTKYYNKTEEKNND